MGEEIPLVGLVFILHIFHFWRKIPQPFFYYGILLLLVGALKAKYMFLATPFLLMGLIQKEKSVGLQIRGTKIPIMLFVVIFGISFVFMAQSFYPQQSDLREISNLIELSADQNLPLYNDWSSGWFFTYLGFETNYKASPPSPDWNSLSKPFFAYSSVEELPCSKIPKTRFSYFCS